MKVLRTGLLLVLFSAALVAATGCKNVEMPFRQKPVEEVAPEYVQAQSRAAAADYAGAATLCESYIAANPAGKYRTDAFLLLGDCRMRLESYPAAQNAYEQAQIDARTKAVNARAKAGLGDSMMAQKRFAEAAIAYERALQTDDDALNVPQVLFYMGKAYIRSGNWALGRDRLRKVVDKYPEAPETPEARDIVFSPSNTFSVQTGAFAAVKHAEAAAAKLKAAGFVDTRIIERNYGPAPFAVRVGHYVTYPSALADAARLDKIEPGVRVVP